ncbi:uncharacterized protein Z518_07950 [Rhinocladiella mackenziei CBS 650.93]|uniref:Uncharacterized protein n=1 Tax=Rhinocladiella mackenziei CBS 650.93 TaxID=1442369 RepID=A0A0D2IFI6_9EURO|nr:uncharacterized protein Z518_07950 [Rhinocladiella mackenziei CBS 650.93]KIX02011.1 hypothetical protein Z518_07950 [Rhinocladiella mackenziei CBS 650.93]
MASFNKQSSDSPPHSPRSMDSNSSRSIERKSSSTSSAHSISPISPGLAPKVQLVPYARTASFDVSFSDAERELLNKANFDALDLSSKDFDFEDIFTYDKPQKKLTKVVEVSRPTRDYRDWSNFSFSHYSAAISARTKVNKAKAGIGELYVKNKSDAQKY